VVNASGHPQIYYDEKLIFSDTVGAPLGVVGQCTLAGYVGTSRFFTGYLSNFRVWGRAITPNEVRRLYLDPWAGVAKPPRRYESGAAGDITGTGAFTFGDMTTAGTGALAIKGAGAFTFGDMTVASTGALPIAGTGALAFGDMTISGAGTLPIVGAGAFTFGDMGIAGTGLDPNADVTAAAVGGTRRMRRGSRRIYLPEPEPPIILPASLARGMTQAVYDDDEDAWFLLQ